MTAKQELKKRHAASVVELQTVALPKIEKDGLKPVCENIGKALGVSYQTVVNYVYGRTKDGFLTNAIAKEFKKL